MNKINLIIKREYLSRVKKKSFIIMSILGPILFGALIIIPILLATSDNEERIVVVSDETGLFTNKLTNEHNIIFEYDDRPIETILAEGSDSYGTLLAIPEFDVNRPADILLYSNNSYGLEFERNIENIVQNEVEEIRMQRWGITKSRLDSINARINIVPVNGDSGEEGADSKTASVIGYITSFAIYLFIFIYGAQVMRSVAEEKTNRIVEVIISSVKPFQLMMGKIVGVALVVLTQLGIWIVFTSLIYMAITGYYADELQQMAQNPSGQAMMDPSAKLEQAKVLNDISGNLSSVNLPLILFSFVFFFLSGYLLYASLFAMVGGAVDSMEDSQQFMLPITIPLIASIISISAVLQNPHGGIAIWMSMIPLTSPVVMMMRVPFDVPIWQLIVSMLLLIGGFIATTWMAGRIYRVGILMHGSKVNYKTLWKWFFMKN